jgi:hypothetical protein
MESRLGAHESGGMQTQSMRAVFSFVDLVTAVGGVFLDAFGDHIRPSPAYSLAIIIVLLEFSTCIPLYD